MGAVRDQENAGERESERGRMRKKKNAREGDVMVESSEEMPREKKSGREDTSRYVLHFLRPLCCGLHQCSFPFSPEASKRVLISYSMFRENKK